ncbi:hypothetical protein LTR10_012401 [Elasticomyces elasticus]|nr:hypothetical protein LTR10_012401 [Elasticomyces elasticus]KAK4965876.1 hypothetical protein LTR42_011890 [Elasticomyces elasticus]
MAKTTRPISFMDLPAELRLQIYEDVLVPQNNARQIQYLDRPHRTCSYAQVREPPLLFISRQVREESLNVFYGSNHFYCPTPATLTCWLLHLSDKKRALIRHVRGFALVEDVSMEQALRMAREKASGMELSLSRAGIRLESGVLRVAAKQTGECLVWWIICDSLSMVATREGARCTHVARKVDAAPFLQLRECEDKFVLWDVAEVMSRAIASQEGCSCEVCFLEDIGQLPGLTVRRTSQVQSGPVDGDTRLRMSEESETLLDDCKI